MDIEEEKVKIDEYLTITRIHSDSEILYCDILHDHKLIRPLEVGTIIRIDKPQEFYYKGGGIYTRPIYKNDDSKIKLVKIGVMNSFFLECYIDSWVYIYHKSFR